MMASIDKKIDAIEAAEKVTKDMLGSVSRDIIEYNVLNSSDDVGRVGRLIAVLTPMNKATALIFFDHFLPWKLEGEVFTNKLQGKKKLDRYWDNAKDFLSDENNTIWTWAADNVTVEKQDYNLAENVTKAIQMALAGKAESKRTNAADPLSPMEVLQAVVDAGIDTSDMLSPRS
jgi:hypothetical protein